MAMQFYDQEVGVILQWNIVTPQGTILDLTAGTAQLVVAGNSNSPFAMVISDGPAGQVQYATESGKWASGNYQAQVKLTLGAQTLYTQPTEITVYRTVA